MQTEDRAGAGKLKKYWFKFQISRDEKYPLGLLTGCGVTAWDYSDAIKLLQDRVFKDLPLPTIKEVVEDIDVSSLDKSHVLLNMDVPTTRGVWFPKGYN